MCVFGAGCSELTVTISSPCLVKASLASGGKLGVDMMTSGYFDQTPFKLSFSTRAAGKYEFLVRRVTYAFFDPIPSGDEDEASVPSVINATPRGAGATKGNGLCLSRETWSLERIHRGKVRTDYQCAARGRQPGSITLSNAGSGSFLDCGNLGVKAGQHPRDWKRPSSN